MFARVFLVCLVFYVCLGIRQTDAKIPNWLPACRLDDENLNECAAKNGQKAIAGIVKGDKKYQIPSMTPLKIPKIDIQAGDNLRITLENNEINGLENTIVKGTELQLDKKHMIFKVFIPRANIVGTYNMDGRILILPIEGHGPANITFVDGYYVYSMNYTLQNRDGKEYLTIEDHKIEFTPKRAYYTFENLFGGNEALGKQMNQFLDENWEAVTKDLGATVGETISSIITSIATSLFNKVPFDEVFPA